MDGLKVVSGGEPEPEEIAALLACFRAREAEAQEAQAAASPEEPGESSQAASARERWQGRVSRLGAKGWGWASRITSRR